LIAVERVRETAERIRRLEVQGARNAAIAAVEALKALAEGTEAKSREDFISELSEAKRALFASRPTEPLMRNAVRFVISRVESSNKKKIGDLSRIVASSSNEFLSNLEQSRERTAEIGAKRIRDGMVVFTHCHSSTVTRLLSKAKQNGKSFEVVCTETRPAFQGRITAKEMLELGVKTTFIVDSAARAFMKKADIAILGADGITSEGNVVNKIGTAAIALLANEARTPFYIATELLKYDPATLYGEYETIEERNPDEIWKDAPPYLILRNPAFEVTSRDFIDGIICEEGIISPSAVNEVVRRRYEWLF
jgi:ribose 1,5-bisphosphate isomerase